MSARSIRRVVAAAAATVALVGVGTVSASAIDTITPSQYWGGPIYMATEEGVPLSDGSTIAYGSNPLALPAEGDLVNSFAKPAGAAAARVFIAPVGQEANIAAWNAYGDLGAADSLYLLNVGALQAVIAATGTPSGTGPVAAAGGDYSIGFAWMTNNYQAVVPGGLFYNHVHVNAGTTSTATYTFHRVEAAVVKTDTTTTITSAPASVQTGQAFNLTASVAPAAASGTVQFYAGSTALGTPQTLTSGTATLTGATLGTAGNDLAITAVYSGNSAYNGSTSTAALVDVSLAPINTATSVAAISADGLANHPVNLTATVAPSTATGSVVFTGSVDGGTAVPISGAIPVTAGTASVTITGLGAGDWTINAAFTGSSGSAYQPSASVAAATLTLGSSFPVATPDPQDVVVEVPAGTITITTPWTSDDPLDLGTVQLNDATSTYELAAPVVFGSATDQANAIQVVDRRAGAPGFTAQVAATPFQSGPLSFPAELASLVNVAPHQVMGNPLLVADVAVNDIASLSGSAQTFAVFDPTGADGVNNTADDHDHNGTAWISGEIDLKGIPSSVQPGIYRSTLAFTAF